MGSGFVKDSSSILADELHKPVIKNFEKRKVYSQFKDNIWGVDLADMQSFLFFFNFFFPFFKNNVFTAQLSIK